MQMSRQNIVQSLCDDYCTSNYSFSKSLLFKVFGSTYENAIQMIVERLNWNIGPTCYPVIVESLGCYSQAEVGCIINVYHNMVTGKKIPEYDRERNPQAISNIEKQTSENSGRPLVRVAAVLWELYWGTLDGQVRTDEIIWPLRSAAAQDNRQIPPDISSTSRNIDDAFDWKVWAIGGAIVLGTVGLISLSK